MLKFLRRIALLSLVLSSAPLSAALASESHEHHGSGGSHPAAMAEAASPEASGCGDCLPPTDELPCGDSHGADCTAAGACSVAVPECLAPRTLDVAPIRTELTHLSSAPASNLTSPGTPPPRA